MHGMAKNVENAQQKEPATKSAEEARATGMDEGCLLAGLVFDAAGEPMLPSPQSTNGQTSIRYYGDAKAGRAAADRISRSRLDSRVVAVLRRVRLLKTHWQGDELTEIIRRVLVLDDAIILQLNRRRCIAEWRTRESMLQRLSAEDVVRLVSTCLLPGEELTEAGSTICLKIARLSRPRRPRARTAHTPVLFRG